MAFLSLSAMGGWNQYSVVTALLFFCMLVSFWERMGFSIAFTEIGNDMLLTETEKGSVFAAYYYGFALTQVPGGYMAKRFGGKAVLALSFLLWAPTSALMAIVSNGPDGVVAGVVACRLAIGMAQGVFIPAAQSMLGHWIPPALRGRHFAFAMSGMYAGTAAAMVTVPTLGVFRAINNYVPVFTLRIYNPSPIFQTATITMLNTTNGIQLTVFVAWAVCAAPPALLFGHPLSSLNCTVVSNFGAASTFYAAACLGGLWLAIWLCTGSDAAAHGAQDEHEESGVSGRTATETTLGRWLEEDRPKLDGNRWSTVGMSLDSLDTTSTPYAFRNLWGNARTLSSDRRRPIAEDNPDTAFFSSFASPRAKRMRLRRWPGKSGMGSGDGSRRGSFLRSPVCTGSVSANQAGVLTSHSGDVPDSATNSPDLTAPSTPARSSSITSARSSSMTTARSNSTTSTRSSSMNSTGSISMSSTGSSSTTSARPNSMTSGPAAISSLASSPVNVSSPYIFLTGAPPRPSCTCTCTCTCAASTARERPTDSSVIIPPSAVGSAPICIIAHSPVVIASHGANMDGVRAGGVINKGKPDRSKHRSDIEDYRSGIVGGGDVGNVERDGSSGGLGRGGGGRDIIPKKRMERLAQAIPNCAGDVVDGEEAITNNRDVHGGNGGGAGVGGDGGSSDIIPQKNGTRQREIRAAPTLKVFFAGDAVDEATFTRNKNGGSSRSGRGGFARDGAGIARDGDCGVLRNFIPEEVAMTRNMVTADGVVGEAKSKRGERRNGSLNDASGTVTSSGVGGSERRGIGGGGSVVVPKVTRMTRYAGAVPPLKTVRGGGAVERAKLKRGKRGNVSRNGGGVVASDSGIRGGGNGVGSGDGVIRSKVLQITRDIEAIPVLKARPTDAAGVPQRSPCDLAKPAAPFPWRKMIASPAAWACVAGNVGAGTATNVVISWLPSYYKDFIQVDLEEIGLVAQIFPHLTMMIFSILGGMGYCWLTNDGGFSRAWASKTITGLSFFLALVVFLCMGLAKSPTMATLLTSLALASAATSRGGWSTNHVEIAAPEHAAILYSAANTVSAASSVLSISSTGKILDAFGDEGPARVWAWTAAMGSIGVVCAACGVFFVVFADSDKLLFPATYEEEGERDDAERAQEQRRPGTDDDWVNETPTSSMDPRTLTSPMMT